MKARSLLRLLQLGSQALPIGGYSHSQGLESAIERRVVQDEATVLQWILSVLNFSICTFELPSLRALHAAWLVEDAASVRTLNEEFIATRESAEPRAATLQMGFSLRALMFVLPDMPPQAVDLMRGIEDPCLPCVWGAVAAAWSVAPCESEVAYAWSWIENQVLVAIKTLPMGQSAGQRILCSVGQSVGRRLDAAPSVPRDDRSNFAPALAIACAQHETQYSRLFRS